MASARAAIITLVVAAVGGVTFHALSFPAAYLTGSATAVTLYTTLFRQRAVIPNPLRNVTFAIFGIMLGAGITPDALTELTTLPLALAGLISVIAGATGASYVVLRQIGGWDRMTSLMGSIPGHFSLVMIVAMENGAAVEKVVLAQALRLIALVTLIPFILGGSNASVMRTVGPEDATLVDVGVTVAIALLAMVLAPRLRIPAPALMGPMLVGAILSGSGALTLVVPSWLAAPAFVFLGASIGSRFTGIRPAGLPRMLVASVGSFIVAVAVAVAIAVAVSYVLGVPLGAVFLAYAPGGLDAMIALTFLLGFDVAFVAVLHTARMIILGFSVPLLIPLVRRRWEQHDHAECPGSADASPPHATT